jgi:hypothetical protein
LEEEEERAREQDPQSGSENCTETESMAPPSSNSMEIINTPEVDEVSEVFFDCRSLGKSYFSHVSFSPSAK